MDVVRLLRLSDRDAMDRAFARVVECMEVASCVIEPEEHRLRFVAPNEVSQALVEKIYNDGGLLFCTRHRVHRARAAKDPTEKPELTKSSR